jgi:nitroreductase
VTDQQLDLILKCGIKDPSAMNNQPWRFTVIKMKPLEFGEVKNSLEKHKRLVSTLTPGSNDFGNFINYLRKQAS